MFLGLIFLSLCVSHIIMNTVLYICIYHGMLMLSYFLFGACIIMFLWLGILMNLDAQCRIYVGFFKTV